MSMSCKLPVSSVTYRISFNWISRNPVARAVAPPAVASVWGPAADLLYTNDQGGEGDYLINEALQLKCVLWCLPRRPVISGADQVRCCKVFAPTWPGS